MNILATCLIATDYPTLRLLYIYYRIWALAYFKLQPILENPSLREPIITHLGDKTDMFGRVSSSHPLVSLKVWRSRF